jgi:hypothetical protein
MRESTDIWDDAFRSVTIAAFNLPHEAVAVAPTVALAELRAVAQVLMDRIDLLTDEAVSHARGRTLADLRDVAKGLVRRIDQELGARNGPGAHDGEGRMNAPAD